MKPKTHHDVRISVPIHVYADWKAEAAKYNITVAALVKFAVRAYITDSNTFVDDRRKWSLSEIVARLSKPDDD